MAETDGIASSKLPAANSFFVTRDKFQREKQIMTGRNGNLQFTAGNVFMTGKDWKRQRWVDEKEWKFSLFSTGKGTGMVVFGLEGTGKLLLMTAK